MRKIPALVILIFLLFVSASYAQTTSTGSSTTRLKNTAAQRLETRQNILENKLVTKKTITETKKENFLEKIQLKREQASEAAKLRRVTFQKKVEALKDERKKIVITRINDRIVDSNQKFTDKFSQNLEKLQDILNRVSDKTQAAKALGKDTTQVEQSIKDAQKAIDFAKATITTQAGKTYIIEIPNETVLKVSVGTTVSKFRQDIVKTHKSVVDARQAVHKAARDLAVLVNAKGIFNEKNSATQGGTIETPPLSTQSAEGL